MVPLVNWRPIAVRFLQHLNAVLGVSTESKAISGILWGFRGRTVEIHFPQCRIVGRYQVLFALKMATKSEVVVFRVREQIESEFQSPSSTDSMPTSETLREYSIYVRFGGRHFVLLYVSRLIHALQTA